MPVFVRNDLENKQGGQLTLFYTPRMNTGDDGTGLAWFLAQIFIFSLKYPKRFMKADFTIRK